MQLAKARLGGEAVSRSDSDSIYDAETPRKGWQLSSETMPSPSGAAFGPQQGLDHELALRHPGRAQTGPASPKFADILRQETDLSEGEHKGHLSPPKQEYRGPKFMGLKPSMELFAIAIVYFVQGSLGLSRLATSFFFKDQLGLSPAEVTAWGSLMSLPWMVKPLYGFMSDVVPLCGYKRRSYLALCGFLGCGAWLGLTHVMHVGAAVALLTLGSFSVAFSDVVIDSIVVERTRGVSTSIAAALQSLCWGASAVGNILSSYFSGALVEHFGPQKVFGITSLLPLLAGVSAFMVKESRVTAVPKGALTDLEHKEPPAWTVLKEKGATLWRGLSNPTVAYPAGFLFLWMSTPSGHAALFYFQTNELGMGPEFLGRVSLIAAICSLAGVAIYQGYLKQVPLRVMFFWTHLLGTALGLTVLILTTGYNRTLGISDKVFVMGDSALLTVLHKVGFMPVFVLAARICPEGVEATLFATLMSILNSGGAMSAMLGAALTKAFGVTSENFTHLSALLATCSLSGLLTLPFLCMLPRTLDTESREPRADGSEKAGPKYEPLPQTITPVWSCHQMAHED